MNEKPLWMLDEAPAPKPISFEEMIGMKCPTCETYFIRKKDNQKYCSFKCGKKVYNKKNSAMITHRRRTDPVYAAHLNELSRSYYYQRKGKKADATP